MRRVDFSGNALVYDQRHGAVLADVLARALTQRLRPGSRILDIGAGTGRVSVAFAGLGFQVIAIEPAIPMLRRLQEKAGTVPIGRVAAELLSTAGDRSARTIVLSPQLIVRESSMRRP